MPDKKEPIAWGGGPTPWLDRTFWAVAVLVWGVFLAAIVTGAILDSKSPPEMTCTEVAR